MAAAVVLPRVLGYCPVAVTPQITMNSTRFAGGEAAAVGGRLGITMPAPCISAMVVAVAAGVGHTAAPNCVQVTVLHDRPAATGSLKVALTAGNEPKLAMVMV